MKRIVLFFIILLHTTFVFAQVRSYEEKFIFELLLKTDMTFQDISTKYEKIDSYKYKFSPIKDGLYLYKIVMSDCDYYFIINHLNGKCYKMQGFKKSDIISFVDDYRAEFCYNETVSRIEALNDISDWLSLVNFFNGEKEPVMIDLNKIIKQAEVVYLGPIDQ